MPQRGPLMGGMMLTLLILVGCSPSPVVVPPTSVAAPRPIVTATSERPLGVAVAVTSPTPTPELVGDYPTLVRPRLEHIQQSFGQLEQEIGVAHA